MKTRKILASPLFSGRTEYGFLCWNSFDYLLRMGKTFLPAVNVEKRAKLFVENWKLVYNFSSFFAARKNVFQLKTKQENRQKISDISKKSCHSGKNINKMLKPCFVNTGFSTIAETGKSHTAKGFQQFFNRFSTSII